VRYKAGVHAAAPPPAAAPAAPRRRAAMRAAAVLWWLAATLLLGVVAVGVERKVTWYLAVDQYGYLTFAEDLTHGKVFHDWPLAGAFRRRLPDRIDVLAQTYVWDRGRAYCRYAPGFPLLVAGWKTLFGEHAVHLLNPVVFLALLALALAYQARVSADRWRALVGVTLIILCPTFLHLWALTLVRDLATHLAGIGGLFLLLPVPGRPLGAARAATAGLAVGFAATIRPDAAVYAVPAALLALARWREGRMARVAAAGVLGGLLGLAPLLAYNHAATGSPFRLTQGMELEALLPAGGAPPAAPAGAGYPPGAWQGGTKHGIQGGGFRLSHLPTTLPGNLRLLREAYGDGLLALALLGAALAARQRPALFLSAVPYCVLALLVFSCWSRPDGRYLSGVFVLLPMLVVHGTFGAGDAVARLAARGGRRVGAAGLAAAGLAALALLRPPVPAGALPVLAVVVPLAGAAAALAAGLAPGRPPARLAAPVLALVLVALTAARAAAGDQRRARFQRAEMERARETLARVVRPGALVITTESVGRPAENIDYYSGVAHAVYLTDLARWRIGVGEAAFLAARVGMTAYLLLPRAQSGRDELLADLRRLYRVERVADIPPEQAIDYFVAAAFHRGVHMELHRIDVPAALLRRRGRWRR
jgi:hypothetical protein